MPINPYPSTSPSPSIQIPFVPLQTPTPSLWPISSEVLPTASLPKPVSITSLSSSHATKAPILPTNTHSMQAKAKPGIHKPRIFIASKEPTSVSGALKHEHQQTVMRDDYLSLQRNKMWSLVPLWHGRKHIGCKWVLKVKEKLVGTVHKYKARLVAKGFHQITGQ